MQTSAGRLPCLEGFEKIAHALFHGKDSTRHEDLSHALADPSVDLVAFEKERIKGAVRTDFILSAEIIVISLGTVAGEPFATRFAVLTGIAILMTAGVYGLVAGIVKLDDAGLWLCRSQGEGAGVKARRALGGAILRSAPWLMKRLSWAGLAAMFLVGGSILVHGVPALYQWVEAVTGAAGGFTATLAGLLVDGAVGVLAGGIAVGAATAGRKAMQGAQAH